MQIILLEKSSTSRQPRRRGQGQDGYARNFLIPAAWPSAPRRPPWLSSSPPRRTGEGRRRKLAAAQAQAEKLTGLTVSRPQRPADGRLFGSVGNIDIAEGLKTAGFDIDKAAIRLPEGPFKAIGEFPPMSPCTPTWSPASPWRWWPSKGSRCPKEKASPTGEAFVWGLAVSPLLPLYHVAFMLGSRRRAQPAAAGVVVEDERHRVQVWAVLA